ncbi:hypothetical protein K8353_01140 [Burkholderia contaminans]|nr:hypothetical protein [Burkholderia contaminans]
MRDASVACVSTARNLRTIFSHNPLLHKARVIGDYELNGVTTHLTEGRVF